MTQRIQRANFVPITKRFCCQGATKVAQYGTLKVLKGKTGGYAKDFFDRNEDWRFRIDATIHGNSNSAGRHYNFHYHVTIRGEGTAIYDLWNFIKCPCTRYGKKEAFSL